MFGLEVTDLCEEKMREIERERKIERENRMIDGTSTSGAQNYLITDFTLSP